MLYWNAPALSGARLFVAQFPARWGLGACLATIWVLESQQTLAFIQSNCKRTDIADAGGLRVVVVTGRRSAHFTPALPVMVHHGLTRKKGRAFKSEAENTHSCFRATRSCNAISSSLKR